MNALKTWMLMGILTVLLVLIGKVISGPRGMLIFLIISVAMNAISYWTSGNMAIAMTKSYRVTDGDVPELYAMIRRLAHRANLPMPQVYVTPSPQLNAFATGRNASHAKVAVTEGLLRALPERELEGVLAHEMAHIRNHDILIGSMAATMAGVVTTIANLLQWEMWFGGDNRDRDGGNAWAEVAAMILAPLAATIIQLAISRTREYRADAVGAQLVGDGNPLADALLHLESQSSRTANTFNPATSHLFIINPLRGQSMLQLFSTHPPIEERVRRLRAMRIL